MSANGQVFFTPFLLRTNVMCCNTEIISPRLFKCMSTGSSIKTVLVKISLPRFVLTSAARNPVEYLVLALIVHTHTCIFSSSVFLFEKLLSPLSLFFIIQTKIIKQQNEIGLRTKYIIEICRFVYTDP